MFATVLSGVSRYHRITKDPEALRGLSAGIDQLIREAWVEEAKTFKTTACTALQPTEMSSVTFLGSEAFAYESALTGNKEHLRIFRTAFRTAMNAAVRSLARKRLEGGGRTGDYTRLFHFTPYGLPALEE